MPDLQAFLMVFLGGGLGSISRYAISRLVIAVRYKGLLPLATLTANVLACIMMALVLSQILKGRDISESWKNFWLIGFCGGFSTFSTFSYENYLLLKGENFVWLLINVFVSVILCLTVFLFLNSYTSTNG